MVVRDGSGPARFHPVRLDGDATSMRFFDGFLDRFGGVSFRLDAPLERLARMLGLAWQAPRFVLGNLGPFLLHWLRRGDTRHPIRFAARLVTGRASLRPLVIVSHHFMSRAETETPLGQERLDLCVFHVPIDGTLMPMCQVNTGGARDAVYAQLARSGTTQLTPRQEVS
jgi:hypothetical protein